MPYRPITTPAELTVRRIEGVTREDHWLDFKDVGGNGHPYTSNDDGKRECRRDIAQFANAGGGNIMVGAQEVDHLFAGYTVVPDPQETIRWIDEVVKANLEPTPAVEPHVITAATGLAAASCPIWRCAYVR